MHYCCTVPSLYLPHSVYYIFLFDSTGRDGLSHAHEAGLVRVPVQLVAVLDNRTGVSPIIKVYLLTYLLL